MLLSLPSELNYKDFSVFDEVHMLLSEAPPPISFIDELRLCLRQTLGGPSGPGSTKNSFV